MPAAVTPGGQDRHTERASPANRGQRRVSARRARSPAGFLSVERAPRARRLTRTWVTVRKWVTARTAATARILECARNPDHAHPASRRAHWAGV